MNSIITIMYYYYYCFIISYLNLGLCTHLVLACTGHLFLFLFLFCVLLLYIVLVLSSVSVVCVRADSVKGPWLLSQHVNKLIELNYISKMRIEFHQVQ
jgi:hypothetical protein